LESDGEVSCLRFEEEKKKRKTGTVESGKEV
jgi:hypothetical protein